MKRITERPADLRPEADGVLPPGPEVAPGPQRQQFVGRHVLYFLRSDHSKPGIRGQVSKFGFDEAHELRPPQGAGTLQRVDREVFKIWTKPKHRQKFSSFSFRQDSEAGSV